MNTKVIAGIVGIIAGAVLGGGAVAGGIAATKKDENDEAADKALNDADEKFIENNHDYENKGDVEQDQ